ncbi:dimethyladenosine transferase [Vibrio parahaemolyticus]|uniref:dimethyladenosine transferase n=1 Tax=Vibrio parahaemolyticus TaxID=670 RepID=UPI00084A6AAA|nr:dimethyladenosine transferase [Vibrio parahaemolyticus]EID0733677.1 dimethyladenosine transferase [Vibrio parahaemolyticus]ELA9417311.1 dimethyladenosine transferase [Vibrio parahaemolyticus]ODY13066.1 dimethyladenosine transferase [Vibrio parahaemolyticus]
MGKTLFSLQPAYSLNSNVFSKVNILAGALFDNGIISLSFLGGIVFSPSNETLIQCKLHSFDLDMTFYVKQREIERLTGIEFSHMDEKYLSYLISQHFLKYGISFGNVSDRDLDNDNKIFIKSMLWIDNKKIEILVDLNEINLDEGCLIYQKNKLPGTLRLKTSLNILDTVLDTTEIASLTTDDVVLVYPK